MHLAAEPLTGAGGDPVADGGRLVPDQVMVPVGRGLAESAVRRLDGLTVERQQRRIVVDRTSDQDRHLLLHVEVLGSPDLDEPTRSWPRLHDPRLQVGTCDGIEESARKVAHLRRDQHRGRHGQLHGYRDHDGLRFGVFNSTRTRARILGMATRTKLTIAYLGGPFHGWQRQPDRRTVQGEIERALTAMTGGIASTVVGAGRTDAGVHAAGQVAHIDLPSPIPSDGLVRGLNGLLPNEIRIRAAVTVPDAFHARRSARGKLYSYRVRWRPSPLPWVGVRAAVLPHLAAESELARAASVLVGRHDFASFTVPDAAAEPTVRTLYRIRLDRRRAGIDLHFVGDGFLRYQVRRMVAALLEVGRGRLTAVELRRLLDEPFPGRAASDRTGSRADSGAGFLPFQPAPRAVTSVAPWRADLTTLVRRPGGPFGGIDTRQSAAHRCGRLPCPGENDAASR